MTPLAGPAAGALAVLLGLALPLLAWAAARLARRHGWGPETPRKLVHAGACGLAIPLPWIFAADWPIWTVLALSAVALGAMRLRGARGAGAALHGVSRRSWGDLLMAGSIALLLALRGDAPVLYVLPLAILALADAAAALAGIAYGRRFFATVEGRKSLEGSAIFFLVAVILSMVCLLLLTGMPRATVVVSAFALAGFATLIEADSWRGFDNLFLPLGAHLFLVAVHGGTAAETAAQLVPPCLGALLAWIAARRFGATGQSARAHAAAFFLILIATGPMNAVLPALFLLAGPAVRGAGGPSARSMEGYEALAAVAVLSGAALAAGALLGRSAIDQYGLACAAAAAARLAGAGAGAGGGAEGPRGLAAAVLPLLGASALWAVWAVTARWNGFSASPGPGALAAGAGVIALCALVPRRVPAAAAPGLAMTLAGLPAALVFLFIGDAP